jgi:uncharacterized BrkB/YihY/UPF0761 family membrane protein
MGNEGLGGAFLLAVGGTILFAMLYLITVYLTTFRNQNSGSIIFFLIFSFLGFFILGLGLWLIAQSGKYKQAVTFQDTHL